MTQLPGQAWDTIWARWASVWETRPPEQAVVDLAARLKSERRRRVHDLGCGLGRHLVFLAAEGLDAAGSDISPTAVRECRQRLRQAGLAAQVTLSDMTDIPAEDASLDAVIAWDLLYHGTLADMKEAMAAVRRKLAPGGYLVATFNSVQSTNYQRSREAVDRGEAQEVEPDTFIVPGDTDSDKALLHHYTTESELRRELLIGFQVLSLTRYSGPKYERGGNTHQRVVWHLLARKIAEQTTADVYPSEKYRSVR
jgi:tellurite methyltransferase